MNYIRRALRVLVLRRWPCVVILICAYGVGWLTGAHLGFRQLYAVFFCG